MKNFVKVASLAATLALAACQTNPNTTAYPKEDQVASRHVADSQDQIWLSGDYGAQAGGDKHCWQTGYYPDGNAVVGCDAVAKQPVKGPVALTADAGALFDFDKATLRPQGQTTLTAIASFLRSISFTDSIVVGHTDSFGSDAYNDRLSARRAEAVKAFLVSQGVSAAKIQTQGMGKRDLKVDPANCKGNRAAKIACEQPNRRVEISIGGAEVPENQVSQWKQTLQAAGVNVR
ncbi:membrane protein [Formosimonas limnophila]|uniref:Membrane protein n=1 Tax=Formosimonas limnophila TaxID=1384487 RepID=A0A8J3CMQ5_9BURK|nr:OmpA family protein [Formosimonas limnophila]GHA73444.1 membrane protein [Formosimonas limnophila]